MPNIVIRNKFTNLNNQSNGNTPSDFVKTYTLRKSATELVYPVSVNSITQPLLYTDSEESQVQAFNLNGKTVEVDYLTASQSANLYSDSLQMEGRCFNLESLSLGTPLINDTTDAIQAAFDQAHTVMLLVVSFDTNFLREKRVLIDNDTITLDYNVPGAVSKQTDELKLRSAVKYGLNKLTETLGYTEPVAIGSIQLDTDNPHAHIVLTETAERNKSNAKFFYDGLEWGTLNPQQLDVFSKAIEFDLTQNQLLLAYPSSNIKASLDRSRANITNLSNVKLYAQIAALSILPEDNTVAKDLRDTVREQIGLSKKHIGQVVTEAKTAVKNNPTSISPYLKIQVTPLANQFDLSKNLQNFSKKKKIREAKQQQLLQQVINQFQQSTYVLRNGNFTEDQHLLAKLKLVTALYETAENDQYVYQKPASKEDVVQYQNDISDLNELIMAEDNADFTLAKEQMLEVVVNATLDHTLTAQDVDVVLASNFKTIPPIARFKPALDMAQLESTKLNIDLTIEKLELSTQLPTIISTQSDRLVATSKLVIPQVTPDSDINDIMAQLEQTDGIYEALQTSAEYFDEIERNAKHVKTPQTLSELEQLFILEDPISKTLINNATLHHEDALEIIHRNSEIEKTYGPDF